MSERLKLPAICLEIKETPGILKIGCDLDGVVADIMPAVRDMILERFNIDVYEIANGKDSTEYWLHEWPEIRAITGGSEFVLNMWHNPGLYLAAKQIPRAVSSINEWRKLGHQIWFITARDKVVAEATLTWLEENELGWAVKENRVLFPQSSEEDRLSFKSSLARELGLHVLIEDYANVFEHLNSSPSLMVKILLTHPYNVGKDAGSQVLRVSSWSEIVAVIQEASRWHYHIFSMSHNVDISINSV